jgi:hypothetical protein
MIHQDEVQIAQGAAARAQNVVNQTPAQQQIPTPAQIQQALSNRPPADVINLGRILESILGLFGIHIANVSTGNSLSSSPPVPVPIPSNLTWIIAIANGHGWDLHGKNAFKSKADYQNMILETVQNAKGGDIVRNPDGRKGVTGYWNESQGFVVWRDKNHPDQGTAFHPDQPDVYKTKWGFE